MSSIIFQKHKIISVVNEKKVHFIIYIYIYFFLEESEISHIFKKKHYASSCEI